jgi:predicted nucleic acid-binding protein
VENGHGTIYIVYKFFVDTNILVYTLDQNDPVKQQTSRALLRQSPTQNNAVISTQVLQEFYVTATQKLRVSPLLAKNILRTLQKIETISITPALIEQAIDCSILNQISFWDALIAVSAESSRCEILLTEDLNNGQLISGVLVQNPFITEQ